MQRISGQSCLSLHPVALFAALVFPQLLVNQENLISFDDETIAGLAALITAWKTRNIIFTMVASVVILYITNNIIFSIIFSRMKSD
ncbi:MAG TPA: AzlD domain-containing protein [Archaeoglobaceae archaeon]|nr:AzlD domain-containing protein [Archaeoglobaceae archaeon]